MIQFNLRPAVETDQPKIKAIIHRVGINPLDLNWRHFITAELADGTFIGCGQLKPHKDGSLELASLAVDEKYRSAGVARALMERLMAETEGVPSPSRPWRSSEARHPRLFAHRARSGWLRTPLPFRLTPLRGVNGAADGVRTHDVQLGKLAFYR